MAGDGKTVYFQNAVLATDLVALNSKLNIRADKLHERNGVDR